MDDGTTAALDMWSEFPVDADPRPLVLTGPTAGSPGFRTVEEAKSRVSAVLESASAVMVLTEETIREGIKTIPLAAAQHAVVVTLAAPLGARVLVHPSGFPLSVERA